MIYAALMTAGILEFIFALILVLQFFDREAEIEAAYQDGYEYGLQIGKYLGVDTSATARFIDEVAGFTREDLTDPDQDTYYDALVDEANCWLGMDGDA